MWPFSRSGPPSRRTVIRRSQLLARKGRLEEAAELLKAFCAEHPDDYAAILNLGAVFYADAKYTPAIDQFEHALEIKPDSPAAWLNIGAARNALGHVDEAIEALIKALELDPKHRDCHFNLAVAQNKKGRPLAAMAELEMELALHPDHEQARVLAAALKAALLTSEADQ